MRESGGQLRGDEAGKKAGRLGLDRRRVDEDRAAGPARVGADSIQPDGNDPSDETVLPVPLPSPVPPHGEIALDIAFRAKLPKIFARTGFVRDYYLVGPVVPEDRRLRARRNARTRDRRLELPRLPRELRVLRGLWHFDVTLTVPSRFVVGATGKRVSETTARATGRPTATSRTNVHDFAWTADPRFIVVEFPFDPARDIPAGWSARAARGARHAGGRDRVEARLLPAPAPAGPRARPRALHPVHPRRRSPSTACGSARTRTRR